MCFVSIGRLIVIFFYINILIFCHVFPNTSQYFDEHVKFHSKLCQNVYVIILLVTFNTEILKILFFAYSQFKKNQDRIFSVIIVSLLPQCPLHMIVSAVTSVCHRKESKHINFPSFFCFCF